MHRGARAVSVYQPSTGTHRSQRKRILFKHLRATSRRGRTESSDSTARKYLQKAHFL